MADAICNGPPPSFVREDLGAAITFARYLPKLKAIPGGPQKLSEPFSKFLEDANVRISTVQPCSRCKTHEVHKAKQLETAVKTFVPFRSQIPSSRTGWTCLHFCFKVCHHMEPRLQ